MTATPAAASDGFFPSASGGHVLVTGGTGFIGQSLVPALARQGWCVTILTRGTELPLPLRLAQVRAVRSLQEVGASDVVDAVINLAGARILGLPWTEARREQLLRSRVGLTRALVAWIETRSRRPRFLLSASAIGYYGVQPRDNDTQLTESSPPQPMFMSHLCQQWEQAAQEAAALGVAVACLRFGLVLGRGGALPMLLLPVRLGLGGRLGSGRQWMSWIHLEDLLRAIGHAWQEMERAPGTSFNVYNVTAPGAVRQREFSSIAAAVLRRPDVVPTPGWPLRLLLGEQSDLLLEGQRVAPAQLQQEGFVFRYPQLRQALEQLTVAER